MTNGEKYLKDGVDRVTFMQAFRSWYFNIERMAEPVDMTIEDFLRAKIKPTLTEDEKVILREADKEYRRIRRNESGDLYIGVDYFGMYNHLFQFIKPGEKYKISDLLEE